MTTETDTRDAIAAAVGTLDFYTAFTVYPDGTVTTARAASHVPDVWHSETDDVDIESDDWTALTGLTGQYGYNGAVMHPSEQMSRYIAGEMLRLSEDEPQTFALAVVNVFETHNEDDDPEPAGWTILRYNRKDHDS